MARIWICCCLLSLIMVAVCDDSDNTTAATVTTIASSNDTIAVTKKPSHCHCLPLDKAHKRMRQCKAKYHAPSKAEAVKVRKAERWAFINCTAEYARDMHAVEYTERLFDDSGYGKKVLDCYQKQRKASMLARGLSPELSNRSYRKCLADAMKTSSKKD